MESQSTHVNLQNVRRKIITILSDITFADVYKALHTTFEESDNEQLTTLIQNIRDAISKFKIPPKYDSALEHMCQSSAVNNRPQRILESWFEEEFLDYLFQPNSDEDLFVIQPIQDSVRTFFEECFTELGKEIASLVVEFLNGQSIYPNDLNSMVTDYNHFTFITQLYSVRVRTSTSAPRRSRVSRKNSSNVPQPDEEEKKSQSQSSGSVLLARSSATSFSGEYTSPPKKKNLLQGLSSYKKPSGTQSMFSPKATKSDLSAIESKKSSDEEESREQTFEDLILSNFDITLDQLTDELMQLARDLPKYKRFVQTMPRTLRLRQELLIFHEDCTDPSLYRSSVRKFMNMNADLFTQVQEYVSEFKLKQEQEQKKEEDALREYNDAIKPYQDYLDQHADSINNFVSQVTALKSIEIDPQDQNFVAHFAQFYEYYSNHDTANFKKLFEEFEEAVVALQQLENPDSVKVPEPFKKNE